MIKVTCPRCNGKAEAPTIQEARANLDHSNGRYLGKPCADGIVELIVSGNERRPTVKPESDSVINKTKNLFSR